VPERKPGFFVKIKEDENFNHPSTICRTYPGEMCFAVAIANFTPVPSSGATGQAGRSGKGRHMFNISRIIF